MKTKVWEHKLFIDLSIEDLTQLGLDGWEMVGLTSYQTGGGFSVNGTGGSSYSVHVQYAFKRSFTKDIPIGLYSEETNLELGKYQIFLAEKYSIERNIIVDKYIVENQVFDTLDEALRSCNELEEAAIKTAHQNEVEEEAKKEALEKIAIARSLARAEDEAATKEQRIIHVEVPRPVLWELKAKK